MGGFWFGIVVCLIGVGFMVWWGCKLCTDGDIRVGRLYIILAMVMAMILIVGLNLWKPDPNAHQCNCEYCTMEGEG